MAKNIEEQLVKYLTDVHALEEQALQQLKKAAQIAGDPETAQVYRDHLAETEEQERLVRARLEAHGAGPSRVKDVAMKVGGLGAGLTAQLSPDTPGKLAASSFSFEHLEIASYELLHRVAQRAGDEETATVAQRILEQERAAAQKVAGTFDRAVERSLQDQGATA